MSLAFTLNAQICSAALASALCKNWGTNDNIIKNAANDNKIIARKEIANDFLFREKAISYPLYNKP